MSDDENHFSMLELDLPGQVIAPAPQPAPQPAQPAPAPVSSSTHCECTFTVARPLPMAERGVCPTCRKPRRRPVVAPGALQGARGPESEAIRSTLGVQQTIRTTQQQTSARVEQRVVTEVVDGPVEPALRKGNMIAGAVAEGHGVLLGFGGRGSMPRQQLLATLTGAGFPAEWAPGITSAHRHAGRVLGALNSLGYVCRADRTKSIVRQQAQQAAARGERVEVPTWTARWHVVRASRLAETGGAYGRVVMIATITSSDTLELQTTDRELGEKVRAEYEARIAGETYNASDVSDWLKSTLVHRFRAARLGGNWYVKRQHAAAAERLLSAFSKVWGEDFLLPALPVASSEQLRTGIAASFAREVDEVLTEYRTKRDEAKAERRELSSRAATSIHARLRELVERCVGFAALLGDAHVHGLRTRCVAASEEIQGSIDGISQRFGLIFDELARDAARGEGKATKS